MTSLSRGNQQRMLMGSEIKCTRATHFHDINVAWVVTWWEEGISVGLKDSDDHIDGILAAKNRTEVACEPDREVEQPYIVSDGEDLLHQSETATIGTQIWPREGQGYIHDTMRNSQKNLYLACHWHHSKSQWL